MHNPPGTTKVLQCKNLRYTAIALGLTLLYILAVGLVFGIRYEVNDDAIISNIAAGAYGPASQYLIYVNILFGWVLKPFYALIPGINWFFVLLLGGGILCFTLLGRLIMQRMGLRRGIILYGIFLLMAGFEFFHRFHYVRYAGLFLTVGLVLLAQNLGRWNAGSIGGILLAFTGSLLRFEQLFSIGALSAALLLYLFFTLKKPLRLHAALGVALLLALCFGAKAADTMLYRANPEWERFVRFNAARNEISDFRIQFGTPEHLAQLGLSENDFTTVLNWGYYDPEVFTPEFMEQIAAALPTNSMGTAFKATVRAGFNMLHTQPLHILFSTLLLGWLFLSGKKRWPVMAGTLALLGLLVFYLNLRGRYIPRVSYSLTLAALVFCAFCFVWPPPPLRWLSLAAGMLAISMLPALQAARLTAADYTASRPPRAAHINELAQNKGTLYLLDGELVDAANGYNVWQARPAGYFSNMVFVGSWLAASPFQNSVLAAYNTPNPYRDSINREDVLFAETVNRAQKEIYIREHYHPTAILELAEEKISFNLYRAITP